MTEELLTYIYGKKYFVAKIGECSADVYISTYRLPPIYYQVVAHKVRTLRFSQHHISHRTVVVFELDI